MRIDFHIEKNDLIINFDKLEHNKNIRIDDIKIEGDGLKLGNMEIFLEKNRIFRYPMILYDKRILLKHLLEGIINGRINVNYKGLIIKAYIEYEIVEKKNRIDYIHPYLIQKLTDNRKEYFNIQWHEKIKEIEINIDGDYEINLRINGNIYNDYKILNNVIVLNREIDFRFLMSVYIEIIFNNYNKRKIIIIGRGSKILDYNNINNFRMDNTFSENVYYEINKPYEYTDYLINNFMF